MKNMIAELKAELTELIENHFAESIFYCIDKYCENYSDVTNLSQITQETISDWIDIVICDMKNDGYFDD